ncbi:protein translocase subunit SecF [Nocardioides cavernaquae]|uniref:Protein-export membrane protein SecF n=1 Tax=Nocardioides cavernaquae TaxID=2321396 RepID=A0A3A5H9R9_9ACTN|nr:protein translocase subunit SecF [Nocardioides cavernaquae]RJS47389.1 protein translocase subunit SecF [Nocardioides cavernaquae]
MGKFSRIGNDLYNGKRSIDFVGRRTLWYVITGLIVGVALLSVIVKPLHFGIEFTGGTEYRISDLSSAQASQSSADEVRAAVADTGFPEAASPTVTTVNNDALLVQIENLSTEESKTVQEAILAALGDDQLQVSQSDVSASWGQEVAQRAGLGVLVFLIIVVLFIWSYFREWKMSVAAIVALIHDIVITIGVYAASGFPVTPAAVTGLLAILGFSLYDTVVVFDKIRENTAEMSKTRLSYADATNLAVNQTLVRSVNTGIVALIPLGAILFVSAAMLGSSSLKDLALSQFVGMAAGVFSSVFVAPRVLVHMKSGETAVIQADRRAKARARNRAADPYAAVVPEYRENMPVYDEKSGRPEGRR